MLEQKKLPILEALAAFGIGGIFTAACMAGLAYLMANQSLAQSTAWPMVSAIVCAGSFCSGWLTAVRPSRRRLCGFWRCICIPCEGVGRSCPGRRGVVY